VNQLELNAQAERLSEQADSLFFAIKDFDGEMALHGMPGYSQLFASLKNAVATIDIILKAYDKGANQEHFAAIARLDIADIERKIGNLSNH
jgi:hypothetical protein